VALSRRGAARNDDEKDDAEEDGGDGGDPDQAAHRLLELLKREGDHEGEDDRQLSEHKAINLSCEGGSDAGFIEVVDWLFLFCLGVLPAFGSCCFHHSLLFMSQDSLSPLNLVVFARFVIFHRLQGVTVH